MAEESTAKPAEKIEEPEKEQKIEEKKTAEKPKESLKEKLVEKIKPEKKEKEAKIILEREYVVPLRRKVRLVPRYRRAKKAVRVLKEFIAKNMKVQERDIRNVKVDIHLNNELWFRGIKKPQAKIKIKAKKYDNGLVYVELAEIPEARKWMMEKEKKKEKAAVKVSKPEEKEQKQRGGEASGNREGALSTAEEKQEAKEKEAASAEAGLKMQKQEAKQMKHMTSEKPRDREQIHRKAMER